MATPTIPDAATLRAITLFLNRIADRYAIEEVWLYGSRARGDARPDSDADVAIILDGPRRKASMVATELGGFAMLESGIFVAPLPIYREEWRQPSLHSNP